MRWRASIAHTCAPELTFWLSGVWRMRRWFAGSFRKTPGARFSELLSTFDFIAKFPLAQRTITRVHFELAGALKRKGAAPAYLSARCLRGTLRIEQPHE